MSTLAGRRAAALPGRMLGRRFLPEAACAVVLAALAVVAAWPASQDPVRWTPDGLFYQARILELRGADHDDAYSEVFTGPLSERARTIDPERTGDPAWVAYNEQFYERRLALPLAAAAIYPAAGERSLLYVSLAGYVAAVLAVFLLLLLRFRLAIAAAALATLYLPALTHHSSYPLTDSWGLALQTAALGFAVLALDRGRRWIAPFALAVLVLSFTRDSTWIPVLAAVWCAYRFRTRTAVALAASGFAAALPAVLAFSVPMRELVAFNVVGHDPAPDATWGFIAEHYPGALVDHVRGNLGFVRRGEWYTGAYFAGGLIALFALTRRSREALPTLLKAAAVVALLYVVSIPAFSAFRVELVLVPMAAYGLAFALERLVALRGGLRPARAPSR
ncbi:MAG TPA: hypothetical protein VF236_01110 [Gaiellaceae bacterium]